MEPPTRTHVQNEEQAERHIRSQFGQCPKDYPVSVETYRIDRSFLMNGRLGLSFNSYATGDCTTDTRPKHGDISYFPQIPSPSSRSRFLEHLQNGYQQAVSKLDAHRNPEVCSFFGPNPNLAIARRTSVYPDVIIYGDLNNILFNWNEEEIKARRRIIVFERCESNGEVHLSFRPILRRQWHDEMAAISCIYYEEMSSFYFTSVDILRFLEKLLYIQLRPEEKGRLRRKLETFHPLTVSKSNSGKSLFHLVMSYKTPQPRSIHRGIKVFHWVYLEAAIRGLIGYMSKSSKN